jgi:hypothetical protein
MPTIAYFYGIAIQMFYNDHNPPRARTQIPLEKVAGPDADE